MGCGHSTFHQSNTEGATPNRHFKLVGKQRTIRPVTTDKTSVMAKISSKDGINGGGYDRGSASADSQDKKNISLSNIKQNSINIVKKRRSFRTKIYQPKDNDGMAQPEAEVKAMAAPDEKKNNEDRYIGQDQNEDNIHEMEMKELSERQDQISGAESPSFKEYCQTHDSRDYPSFSDYCDEHSNH